jgi:hypothetical protein
MRRLDTCQLELHVPDLALQLGDLGRLARERGVVCCQLRVGE